MHAMKLNEHLLFNIVDIEILNFNLQAFSEESIDPLQSGRKSVKVLANFPRDIVSNFDMAVTS